MIPKGLFFDDGGPGSGRQAGASGSQQQGSGGGGHQFSVRLPNQSIADFQRMRNKMYSKQGIPKGKKLK